MSGQVSTFINEHNHDWIDSAACLNQPPHQFYPGRNDSDKHAKQICVGFAEVGIPPCPVRRECAAFAVASDERFAVRAGFRCSSKDERKRLREWHAAAPATPGRWLCGGWCERPVRPRGTSLDKAPDTVEIRANNMCAACYEGSRNRELRNGTATCTSSAGESDAGSAVHRSTS